MNILALVTARGGSKGFPGKNLALLAGRPLVAWSHALLSTFRLHHPESRLFLSTDSPDIAAAWPEADAPRRLRPIELASDMASSMEVVLHELNEADREGFYADAILLLQPTSPLLALKDLETAWNIMENGAESVVGMVPMDHPIEWTWRQAQDGTLHPLREPSYATRRQELSMGLRPVGFYLARRSFLEAHESFIVADQTIGTIVAPVRGIDIDHPKDLYAAQGILAGRPLRAIKFGLQLIGPADPCYVIAEVGVNHNGNLDRALEMVHEAAKAGANAVKFQTFRAEELVIRTARKAEYQTSNTRSGGSQFEMLKALELSSDDFVRLKEECRQVGIQFLSTPFDRESAEFLASLGVDGFKVSSGDLTNLPFLRQLASYGKPIILSTGMATLQETEEAVQAVRGAGAPPIAILHCLSAYPAPPEQYNLRAIQSLQEIFQVPVGLSDHALGAELALAAVALGAKVIEKHFTLDKNLPGPDHAASLEPPDLAAFIAAIRVVESALGDGCKRPMPAEADAREVARKSLVFTVSIPKGTMIAAEHIAIKRPGSGIQPRDLERVLGRHLAQDVEADTLVSWDAILEVK